MTDYFLVGSIAFLGLLVGSFLNVVIYRLPIMMDRKEKEYAQILMGIEVKEEPPFNLLFPPSRCVKCFKKIRPWSNIPVISFLLQLGKCSSCKTPISWRYPFVEALTAVFSAIVAVKFGDNYYQLAVALLFTWSLVVLFFIDADTQLLPDVITLPLMWLGILAGVFELFIPLKQAVIGAMVGYLLLWTVFWLFKIVTGKEGMGFGDFKLLAGLTAFQGVQSIPNILLIATITGIAFALFSKIKSGQPMAFGPFLIIGGYETFLFGSYFVFY